MKFKFKLMVVPVVLLIVGLACNMGVPAPSTPDPFATLNVLYTAAAQTKAASVPSGTSKPSGAAATSTAFPTLAIVTPVRTAAPVLLCNAAGFISDVSIADGSIIGAGNDFTKTWRLQNTGTCTWNSSYSLVFVSGDRMSGSSPLGLPGTVSPGQAINLSVDLTAPTGNGEYQGYWKLRDPSGNLFGIGA